MGRLLHFLCRITAPESEFDYCPRQAIGIEVIHERIGIHLLEVEDPVSWPRILQ